MTEAWSENPLFWEALDECMAQAWLPLKELLDVLFEHADEMEPPIQAILFGGIGRFVQVYTVRRGEANTPDQCFNEAANAVYHDRRIQDLIGASARQAVDSAVDRMKEGA